MQTPDPWPHGGVQPPTPNSKGSRSALQSLLKGRAKGDVMFPFHRKPNIVLRGCKCHGNKAIIPVFSLTSTSWDIIRHLYSIPFKHKVHPEPWLHTRTGQTGHTGFWQQSDVSFLLSPAPTMGLSLGLSYWWSPGTGGCSDQPLSLLATPSL